MKYTNCNVQAGDVQLYSIDKLPKGAKRIENKPVAWGETSGHAHVLNGDVELFELDGQIFAVVGKDGAFHSHIDTGAVKLTPEMMRVNASLSNADHTKECVLEPDTISKVGIHQAYDYFDKKFKKVVD